MSKVDVVELHYNVRGSGDELICFCGPEKSASSVLSERFNGPAMGSIAFLKENSMFGVLVKGWCMEAATAITSPGSYSCCPSHLNSAVAAQYPLLSLLDGLGVTVCPASLLLSLLTHECQRTKAEIHIRSGGASG